ncbi:aldose 1-epimerase [Varibaculum vaginae]|uniref:aldose 1-epimerase n=1 Tax=Varibaculum vaginae TaxID=2364797 RepID=UPI000F09931C|nr:hypothetical protein [Varibaculum vaginae]
MSQEIWTLKAGKDSVSIAKIGATVLDWQVKDLFEEPSEDHTPLDAPRELEERTAHVIDGYRDEAEAREMDGFRSAVLAPWSNRLRDGKYTFQGREYDFQGKTVGGVQALHGLVADQPFELVESGADFLRAKVQVTKLDAYPFDVEIEVTYRLTCDPHRLSLDILARNLGEGAAPITLGWHPYIACQGGSVENTRVTVPSQVRVQTDKNLIPEPGIRGFSTQSYPVTLVNRRDIDWGLTSLVAESGIATAVVDHADGSQTTVELKDARQGLGLATLHVYTAQDLAYRRGLSVAVEPLLAMSDSFNRPECEDLITVPAGGIQEMHAALEHRSPRQLL